MEIHYLSALEIAEKIKSKEISSLELTQHFIDRIEKYDDKINSVIVGKSTAGKFKIIVVQHWSSVSAGQ